MLGRAARLQANLQSALSDHIFWILPLHREMMTNQSHRLLILYGLGGLSDVGRHAVQVALEEHPEIQDVTVLTKFPHLLEEPNWNCGCETPHSFTEEQRKRMKVIHVQDWKKDKNLAEHFRGITSVVSCLGNREPLKRPCDAAEGNTIVMEAMKQHSIQRCVVMSSSGIEEDWPPIESWKPGKIIMSILFMTFSRANFRDLTQVERMYRASSFDYLLVRPIGIGEDVKPVGTWKLQKEKYKDPLGYNMAKLDVARFMVQEAIQPTRHKDAVSIGADPETFYKQQQKT